uniref:CCHC-type domain-containing protein n=1 Tax=Tanacetum cinerariifolium TaxID=118510 RepID=A0A6L2P2W4_TANCI|nr:hypothetical protein [Tanacetum cinerariifolium]
MKTLADKAILSSADNRPPMMEKDMYDSWKSRMELYMMNRQHGRIILESVENGPLFWPTIEENGVTRPKNIMNYLQRKQFKLIVTSRQPISFSKDSHQRTLLTKQEKECKLYDEFDKFTYKNEESLLKTKFLNTLPPEWGKFVTDVKLGRQNSLAAGTSRPYTSGQSGNNSGKQRTVVCYNCKGEGHMSKQCTKPKRKRDEAWFKDKKLKPHSMSSPTTPLIKPMILMLMTLIVTKSILPKIALMANLSHYGFDNLAESETEITSDSNIIPYSQYVSESQYAAVQNLNFPTQQDALILSVIEQLKTQFVNCTKINQENKSVNETLIAELERYKDQKTNAIVIRDSEETLMLEEESRSKMLQKQKDPMIPTQVDVPKELPKVSMVNSSLKKLKFHLASFDVAVEQHRVESNRFQNKMKEVLNENERLLEQAISKDIVNIVVTANVNNAYELVNECERCVTLETELQKDFNKNECYDKLKLKEKAVVDEAVNLHPIDPELLKINVAPLAPKLQNNRTAHYDYLKHTQEETATLREIVENERLRNPLNTSLDYACDKLMAVTLVNKTKKIRFTEPITSSGNTPLKIASSSNVVSNKPMLSSTGVNLPTSASGSQPSGNTKKDRIQQTQSRAKKNKLEAYPRNVRTSLQNKKSVVNTKDIASVPISKLNVKSNL